VNAVSRSIDRLDVTFDDETLVAHAGMIAPATLMVRLGLERLVNATVRLGGRVGGSRPGRKVCSVVATTLAGGTHIDHADMLRAGATQRVLPFRVMAPRRSARSCARSRSGMSVSSTRSSPRPCGARGRWAPALVTGR
jgi:hypothetical protein